MSKLILNQQDFKVLSSETRVLILKTLSGRPHTASELSVKMKLSAPTVKEHLDLLKNAGLIVMTDDSHKWKYFTLSKKGLQLLAPADEQSDNVLVLLSSVGISLAGVGLLAASLLSSDFASNADITAPMMLTKTASADAVVQEAVAASGSLIQQTVSYPLGIEPSFLAFAGLVLLVIGLTWIWSDHVQKKLRS